MASRRMFSLEIIDSDNFLDMPSSAQNLYFHLAMRADDDGFVNNPKKIQRVIGCGDDDVKILIAKQYIFIFESGIVVIKHWRLHNYLRKDRYKKSLNNEAKFLNVLENGEYTLNLNSGIPLVAKRSTQVRLGKDRLEEKKIEVPASNNENEVSEYIQNWNENTAKKDFDKEKIKRKQEKREDNLYASGKETTCN